jgi:hypothetical protein
MLLSIGRLSGPKPPNTLEYARTTDHWMFNAPIYRLARIRRPGAKERPAATCQPNPFRETLGGLTPPNVSRFRPTRPRLKATPAAATKA